MGPSGFLYAPNIEGVPSLAASYVLPTTGWRMAVSLPSTVVERQLLRSLLWLGSVGALLGGVGLSLALIVRGRLQRAVRAVDGLATAMREGRTIVLAPTEVTEIRRVGHALFDASADLRHSEGRLRAVLDNLFVFVGLLDVEGRVLQTNQAPLAILGLKPADVRGVLFWECPWWTLSAETQERVHAAVQAAARGEWVRFDLDFRANGGPITLDFQLAPLRDVEGRIVSLQPLGVDITEHVKAQAEHARREARNAFRSELRDLRYTVIEAKDGEAALLLLRQRPDVEAVISDVGMPGMDGPAFVEAARVFRPTLPVLFMTGQLERERIVGEAVPDKPFGPPHLARAVLELLARGAAR